MAAVFSISGTRTFNSKHQRSSRWLTHALAFNPSSRCLWCYLLHAIFILLHIVLLFMLLCHPEHHIILQSVNEVPTIALAGSLQLFYVVSPFSVAKQNTTGEIDLLIKKIYTLILVFITQRLAVSRAMTRKQSLTSHHDLSQAWTSIGSALFGLWQQAKDTASPCMMLAITTYYLCISVLHVSSTTIMQFEVFSSSKNNTMQSILAWPASFDDTMLSLDWAGLSPIVPLNQLPSLSTNGLLNSTVYDTPLVDSTSVNATVNATTIHADCGLLSNLSKSDSSLYGNVTWGRVNANISNMGAITVFFPTTLCEFSENF